MGPGEVREDPRGMITGFSVAVSQFLVTQQKAMYIYIHVYIHIYIYIQGSLGAVKLVDVQRERFESNSGLLPRGGMFTSECEYGSE